MMAFVTADYKMLLSFRIHVGLFYNQTADFSALGWLVALKDSII